MKSRAFLWMVAILIGSALAVSPMIASPARAQEKKEEKKGEEKKGEEKNEHDLLHSYRSHVSLSSPFPSTSL